MKKIKMKGIFSTLEFLLRKVGKAKSTLSWAAAQQFPNSVPSSHLRVASLLNRPKQDRFQKNSRKFNKACNVVKVDTSSSSRNMFEMETDPVFVES